jgi:hypothetical protein
MALLWCNGPGGSETLTLQVLVGGSNPAIVIFSNMPKIYYEASK